MRLRRRRRLLPVKRKPRVHSLHLYAIAQNKREARKFRKALGIAFGRVLRGARLDAGYSQEELAERADMDRTYPSLLETGKRSPTITTIFFLASALGISAIELIWDTEQFLRLRRANDRFQAMKLVFFSKGKPHV